MDIADWLRGLSLERYAETFRDNAIELEVLPELSEAGPETKSAVKCGVVAQCENGRGCGSGTVVSQKGQPQAAITSTLIRQ